MGMKRRNGSNLPINVRTKSQNSSSTASGVKAQKENEKKKSERFEKKMQSVHDEFQRRVQMHMQQTVDECDKE